MQIQEVNVYVTVGCCKRVLKLPYLPYPRNIPQGRDCAGATFNSTNHHEVARFVFLLGLELENNVTEELQVSTFFLPALFCFIIAGDALLKVSSHCCQGRAGKQSTQQGAAGFAGANLRDLHTSPRNQPKQGCK